MGATNAARILLYSAGGADDLRAILHEAGHAVLPQALDAPLPADWPASQLVVLDGGHKGLEALQTCRRLRRLLTDAFIPILFVTDNADPQARLAGFECGADICLPRPFERGELRAQVQALLRMKDLHNRLTEKTDEVHRVNHRLQEEYQRVDMELELARRIQQSFLPQQLPEPPGIRFAVRYQPRGRVGGDFYDVFRLDEQHVGFYIADAMGHGVPASLLTIFLKRGVLAKEILSKGYRLVPPHEVLQRLNRDLLDQKLADCPFITMVYGLFDFRAGRLDFARAGHPYPLYVPPEHEPQAWQVEGALMGVFEADYFSEQRSLRPGDKLLLYTDGADKAVFEDHPPGLESLLAAVRRHRRLPIQEFVQRLADDLVRPEDFMDDFTLLGMEVK